MNWKPIIVGVDGSEEAVRAAITGIAMARRLGVPCTLVAAVPDYELVLMSYGIIPDVEKAAREMVAQRRETIAATLRNFVPAGAIETLEVNEGPAPTVLAEAARRNNAGLIVIGHRKHRGLDRLRGRIVRHLMRTCDVPLLVANDHAPNINRVLVALDLSYASRPALDTAQQWARLYGAHLRAVHVVQPVPMLPGEAVIISDEYYDADEKVRESGLWSQISDNEMEKVVRYGTAAATIAQEAADWRADLLVVASHGKGWLDRLLVGSTSEQLLHHPPTLTLLVPAAQVAPEPLAIGALPWEEGVPA